MFELDNRRSFSHPSAEGESVAALALNEFKACSYEQDSSMQFIQVRSGNLKPLVN